MLDALEARYPVLRGTIRDPVDPTAAPLRAVLRLQGGPLARDPDAPLPDAVARGAEPFFVIGAMAGG